MTFYRLESLAPLMFGAGRPFSTDSGSLQMKARPLPTPATVSGAVRSWVAREAGWFDEDRTTDLQKASAVGPFLWDGELLLPRPMDAELYDRRGKAVVVARRPREVEGCYLPDGLSPTLEPDDLELAPTKARLKPWWAWSTLLAWLDSGREMSGDQVRGSDGPASEARTHVGLDPERRAHRKGSLFSTEGSCFGRDAAGSALELVFGADLPPEFGALPKFPTLGGDRRPGIARVLELAPNADPRVCPAPLLAKLRGARRFRTVLATPGLFAEGWRPPGPFGARLVGACVDRPEPLNRWRRTIGNLEEGTPKEQRWMAPAGSVYFWEAESPLTDDQIRSLWFASAADTQLDGEPAARFGFGIALIGTWES